VLKDGPIDSSSHLRWLMLVDTFRLDFNLLV
jgi:hypothetical protein